jgi:CRP-like cAMP-binding protein
MTWLSPNRVKDLRLRVGWGWDGSYPKARSLQAVPLFTGCTPSELLTLVGLTSEVGVRAGTELCREGQGPAQFVILTKGRLEVTRNGGSPQTYLPGSYLPASGTRLTVADLPSIRAESDAEVIVMNPAEFASMVALVPSVRAQLAGASQHEVVTDMAPSPPYVSTPAGVGAGAA